MSLFNSKTWLTKLLLVPTYLFVSVAFARGIEIVQVNPKPLLHYQASHALLIGASDYQKGWPDLTSIPGELKLLETTLKQHEFTTVTKVLNPDEDTLRSALESFVDNYGYEENNRLLLFFAGHGFSFENEEVGYLVPTDAPPPKDATAFLQKALAMEEIIALMKKIKAKHVLMAFDSCFSGTVFQTRGYPTVTSKELSEMSQPVRHFITAGSAEEKLPAESVFLPAFIEGISGDADADYNGLITGSELGNYISEKFAFQKREQTPQSGKMASIKFSRGEFTFRNPLKSYSVMDQRKTTAPLPAVKKEQKEQKEQAVEAQLPKPEQQQPAHVTLKTTEYVNETGIGYCTRGFPQSLWSQQSAKAALIVAQANLLERISHVQMSSAQVVTNNQLASTQITRHFSNNITPGDFEVVSTRYLDPEKCESQVVIRMAKTRLEAKFLTAQ